MKPIQSRTDRSFKLRVYAKQFSSREAAEKALHDILKMLESRGYAKTNEKYYPGIKTRIEVYASGDKTTIVKFIDIERPVIEIETDDMHVGAAVVASMNFKRVE